MKEETYKLAFTFHELGLLKRAIWLKIRDIKPELKRLRTEERNQDYSPRLIRMRLDELKEFAQQYNKVEHKIKAILRKLGDRRAS